MKTFKDLEFLDHPNTKSGGDYFKGHLQAKLFFDNGYGVSVVFGDKLHSNGIDTYELAVAKGNAEKFDIMYDTPITDNVMGHQSIDEITEIMGKVQELKQG